MPLYSNGLISNIRRMSNVQRSTSLTNVCSVCVHGRSRPASSRRYESAGGRARSASVASQARLGGGAIVRLRCTGHPTHSTPADYGTGTDTGR